MLYDSNATDTARLTLHEEDVTSEVFDTNDETRAEQTLLSHVLS